MKVKTLQVLWHEKKPVLSVDFDPATGLLASCGTDKEIKLWRVGEDADGNPDVTHEETLTAHTKTVNCVRFSPGGDALASGGMAGRGLRRFAAPWRLHLRPNRYAPHPATTDRASTASPAPPPTPQADAGGGQEAVALGSLVAQLANDPETSHLARDGLLATLRLSLIHISEPTRPY